MKSVIRLWKNGSVREIEAQTGETLLAALSRAGVAVSAPCGGRGRCGKCAVKAKGAVTEKPSECADKLPEGYVLSCQTIIEGDAEVMLSENESRILSMGAVENFQTDGEEGLGVAVDIGTTTIAAYLMDLKTGKTLNCKTMLNPQRNHGADVISRISFAMESTENALLLQNEVLVALDEMTKAMLEETGEMRPIVRRVCVGNTVMMHMLGGYSVEPLAHAPFEPVYTVQHQKQLGEGCETFMGGCISGYVGADTVAATLACDLDINDETALMIDIGTNGEIVLKHKGKFVCCSCAAGPAFEGAHIACGTGAVTGAIDHASLQDGKVTFTTIGGGKPVGICGSGLIDLVSALVENEDISMTGRMDENVSLTENVYLAREDVREVQLAKSAIATGISILMEVMGIDETEIQHVYVAGGFGNFIRMESACGIGMLPQSFLKCVKLVGNAAGDGAKRMLLSETMRRRAADFRALAQYVELAAHPSFNDLYADNLLFGDD